MKIKASRCYSYEPHEWSAVDDDTYDGAEDSSNRHMIGYGATEDEAVEDLKRLMAEKAEYDEMAAERAKVNFDHLISDPKHPDWVRVIDTYRQMSRK